MADIVPSGGGELQSNVDNLATQLTKYLKTLDLPSENVLVAVNERRKVINNLPEVIAHLSDPQRKSATYVSKFIAACVGGLFDAALNYLWDETIRNLRQKVVRFDLEYFYSSVVTDPERRADLKGESDLEKIEDWELIRGCRLTGILSDIGFKHLDYIRDMRNFASAAHPNQNELTGFQLIDWLETCIREVLAKEPEGSVIEVRRLLYSIRNESLTQTDASPIIANIQQLQGSLAESLLRTLFGMYTDLSLVAEARNNIKLIASAVWNQVDEDTRREAGVKYAIFSVNAEVGRKKLAHEFLELVEGLPYLPTDQLELQLSEKIDNLMAAHQGLDNFFNEPPHAKILAAYVPPTGAIPHSVRAKYVKTLVMCRSGNGFGRSLSQGVSWAAVPYYDTLIGRFQDAAIIKVFQLIQDPEVISRLRFPSCAANFKEICHELRPRALNTHTQRGLDLIISCNPSDLSMLSTQPKVKQILAALK
jgi:hypothetical protein